MARHHSEIRKLAPTSAQNSAATTLIANHHDEIARLEREIAELRKQVSSVKSGQISQTDVDAAFADFDNIWNALSPREQAQALSLLIDRVEFDAADSSIGIEFHASSIRTLAENQIGEAA